MTSLRPIYAASYPPSSPWRLTEQEAIALQTAPSASHLSPHTVSLSTSVAQSIFFQALEDLTEFASSVLDVPCAATARTSARLGQGRASSELRVPRAKTPWLDPEVMLDYFQMGQ